MALIANSQVTLAGTSGNPWPGAAGGTPDGTYWTALTYRTNAGTKIASGGIYGGSVSGGSSEQNFTKSDCQPSTPDYEARCTFFIGSGAGGSHSARILIRSSGSADTNYFVVIAGDGGYSLQKRVGGTWIGVLASGSTTLTKNAEHTAYVRAEGSTTTTVTLWIDGSQVLTYDDSSSPITAQGFAGVRAQDEGVYLMGFKSFELHTIDTSPLSVSTIPDQQVTNGSGSPLDIASYATGGTSPYTVAYAAGYSSSDIPDGLTLQSDGTFTGTSTTDGAFVCAFDVTDSAGTPDTVTTNTITFTVSSAVNDPPTWGGVDIPTFNVVEGVAHGGLDISGYWTDTDSFTVSEFGTWPSGSGASIASGSITFNEANFVAGTYNLQAKATDTASNVTNSNTFQVIVSASGTTGTITSPPLKLNNGTLHASLTGLTFHVYETSGALAVTLTGQTTNASGVATLTSSSIVAGTDYRVVPVISGELGIFEATAT